MKARLIFTVSTSTSGAVNLALTNPGSQIAQKNWKITAYQQFSQNTDVI
jgi:hypothetical protein